MHTDNDDEVSPRSILEHYANRDNNLEHLTLKEFAVTYHLSRGILRQCRTSKVLQPIPKVKPNLDDAQDEIFYKQKLLLNKCWRSIDSLKTSATWKESFLDANIPIWELADHDGIDVERDVDNIESDPHDWMTLAAALPHHVPTDVMLGCRDIDRQFDWYNAYHKYPNIEENLNFVKTAKESYSDVFETESALVATLNDEQFDVMRFLGQQLTGSVEDKLTIIQGAAGTGKSFLIKQMVKKVEDTFGNASVLLMAPTGVAANNIGGHTIHSAMRITKTRGSLADLTGENERKFQEDMRRVKVIIIDEMSMIGTRLLSVIDKRLRQAYPTSQDIEFGGAIVYLLGDFNQLPPVKDRSLLAEPSNDIQSLAGRLLFESFTRVFELKQIMRQEGDEQQLFRETLQRLAQGNLTTIDYELLRERFAVNTNAEANDFENAIRIMANKSDISAYNLDRLRMLNKPVALIKSIDKNSSGNRVTSEDAQGLSDTIQLAVGCRVMLKQNIWTEQGLCNGTMGTVIDVIYRPSDTNSHLDDTPLCVLVRFDGYDGPSVYNGLIPIVPQKVGFMKNNVSCFRIQFPLQLAYGVTVHKSQGMTVDKAVVDIGVKEFALGLTYVALSRVKTIKGLRIDPAFPIDRLLRSINMNSSFQQKRIELARLRSLIRV